MLLLNTVLLLDIALLPFAASMPAEAFRDGHGQRTAAVFHGIAFEVAAVLAADVSAIGRRFPLALAWIAAGIALGAVHPPLGVAVIAAFIPYYWLPIAGELAKARRRRA